MSIKKVLGRVEHIDLKKPWWDKNSIDSLSVGGKVFLAASDIQIDDIDKISCILFNKTEAKNYDVGDLYAIVENGGWTLDAFYEICKGKSRDLNGDGKLNDDDFLAFIGQDAVLESFFNGGGGKMAEKDENDFFRFIFMSQRNLDMCERILDFMYDETVHINAGILKNWSNGFAEGGGLFVFSNLIDARIWRNSEVEFGILPIPKMFAEQNSYHSRVSVDGMGILSIPANAPDIDRTGIIAEALSAESRYTVLPAYYEIALKGKYIRDDESGTMVDILLDTRLYDPGVVYGFGGFAASFWNIATTRSRDVVSRYEKAEPLIKRDIDKFTEAIGNIG